MTKKPFFLSPDARRPRDPLDGFTIPVDRSGQVTPSIARVEASRENFKSMYEKNWSPPPSALTFADYDVGAAARLCKSNPAVIIREDPMFGRRGYAREVIPDKEHGYLVLVIAYASRRDSSGRWVEPARPKDVDRRYWSPSKVEFAPR